MKKNIVIVCLCLLFCVSCSKTKGIRGSYLNKKIVDVYIPKGSKESIRKKVDLEYSAFKKLGLPLPENNYGNMIEYLVPVNDNDKPISFSLFKKYDEEKVLEYYKNLSIRGLGDASAYWRWKTAIKKSLWYSQIPNRLLRISKGNYKNIFTLENNMWVQKKLTNTASIGKVKNVKIVGRGPSGIITHILVTTSKGKYLVTKELNVRRLFATNYGLWAARGGDNSYIKNPIVSRVISLPSAHLAFEEKNGYIIIYGAGYGHGVGMPQYAASTLSKTGKDYEDILKRYYHKIKIVNISKILGNNTDIKVGITSRGGELDHNKIIVQSAGNLVMSNKDLNIKLGKNQKVTINSNSWKLIIRTSKGKKYVTNKPVDFYANGYFLTLSPIAKGHTTSPRYRGKITISPYANKLRIINTVDIEKYLLQVVPSEMPQSFGLEALKAQAIAARTYAVSDIQKQKYIKYNFHIKDTIESQVYNNQVENDDATRAVEETKHKIMIYDGKPIDAKYFSTSAGFTNYANDVW